MGEVVAMPLPGRAGSASLPDVRGEHRALQVTWHDEDDVVVISTWRSGRCVSSAQLTPEEAAGLITTLAQGLARRSVQGAAADRPAPTPRRIATGVTRTPEAEPVAQETVAQEPAPWTAPR